MGPAAAAVAIPAGCGGATGVWGGPAVDCDAIVEGGAAATAVSIGRRAGGTPAVGCNATGVGSDAAFPVEHGGAAGVRPAVDCDAIVGGGGVGPTAAISVGRGGSVRVGGGGICPAAAVSRGRAGTD